MTRHANFPACFDSLEGFQQWRQLAVRSGGAVRPCDDCSAVYRQQMERADRCRAEEVRVLFMVPSTWRRGKTAEVPDAAG